MPENIGAGRWETSSDCLAASDSGCLEDVAEVRLIQSMKLHGVGRLFTHTAHFAFTFTIKELMSVITPEIRIAAEEWFGDIGISGVVGRPGRYTGAKSEAAEKMALRKLYSDTNQ